MRRLATQIHATVVAVLVLFAALLGAAWWHGPGMRDAAAPPPGFAAWYEARPQRDEPSLLCGHWSTLGLKLDARVTMLDTGCVWGGALSALRLEDRWLAQQPCAGYQPIGEGT